MYVKKNIRMFVTVLNLLAVASNKYLVFGLRLKGLNLSEEEESPGNKTKETYKWLRVNLIVVARCFKKTPVKV